MQKLVSPSSHLPPSRRLFSLPGPEVREYIVELGRIYAPDVAIFNQVERVKPHNQPLQSPPGKKKSPKIELTEAFDSGYASVVASDDEEGDRRSTAQTLSVAAQNLFKSVTPHLSEEEIAAIEEANDIIRADPFERKYAMNWLTGLIARSEEWLELASDFDETPFAREAVIQLASMLISACTGTSTCGAMARKFVFGPNSKMGVEALPAILVQVNDDALPSQDHSAVGLNTWGSARLLAERMVAEPAHFSLIASFNKQLKVLELGAGTGLLSLVARRMLEAQVAGQNRKSRIPLASTISHIILATDFHPSVLANLDFNISNNMPSTYLPDTHTVSLMSEALDWRDPPVLAADDRFDVVLGADIVYEKLHAEWIRSCVEAMLKKPGRDGDPGGVFWLIYPERPTHQRELESVQKAFFDCVPTQNDDGWMLKGLSEERIERKRGIGRADEECYRLWQIGWVKPLN